MVATWMIYAVAVGTIVIAAVTVLEPLAARRGRARWLWAAALVGALSLPLLRGVVLEIVGAMGPVPEGALALGTPVVVAGAEALVGGLQWLDPLLLGAWLFASVSLALVAFIAARRVSRAVAGARDADVEGTAVSISQAVGPAVLGPLSPRIVLPEWVLSLPVEDLRLVVRHEEEHRRARDPSLLVAGLVCALTMPWNPALWWGLARLRQAVETDCDRRVLARTKGSVRRYARLLLDVGGRSAVRVPLGAGFGERFTTLEHRIRAMLGRRISRRRAASAAAASALLLAGACAIQGPDAPLPTDVRMSEARSADPGQPSFTPYTVAPSILNREEVIRALATEYPPLLRDAGIGGTIKVYFFIDATGMVRSTRVDASSGHQALDEAAMRVADTYRFSPALNGDEAVAVWVSMPITFSVRKP